MLPSRSQSTLFLLFQVHSGFAPSPGTAMILEFHELRSYLAHGTVLLTQRKSCRLKTFVIGLDPDAGSSILGLQPTYGPFSFETHSTMAKCKHTE